MTQDKKCDYQEFGRGRFRVVRKNGEYVLQDAQDGFEGGEFVLVFRDGKLLVEQTVAEIRERVAA